MIFIPNKVITVAERDHSLEKIIKKILKGKSRLYKIYKKKMAEKQESMRNF